MMWGVGWSAGAPDGDSFLGLRYGPNKGQANHARFDLPAFNALYERQRVLPDGPEREAADARGQAADGRLHAVQGARAPHLHRPDAPVGRRLPAPRRSCASSGSTSTSTSTSSARRNEVSGRIATRCCRRARRAAAAAAPARAGADGRAAPTEGAALPFRVAETSFDPAQISDLYSRTVTAAHLRGAVHLRPPGAAGQAQAAHRRRHARGSADYRTWTIKLQARHLLRRRPGVQGPASASSSRRTTSTRSSASPTRPTRARCGRASRTQASSAWRELREAALEEQEAVRLRPPIEGMRALDRYTLQFKLEEPRPRFIETLAGARPARRAGARGGRVLRRRDRRASGGHRAVPARAVAAQLADRARAQPDFRERALRRRAGAPTTPRARRCSRASRAGACRWSTGSSLDHRGGAAALAGVPQRRDRPGRRARAARVRRPWPMPGGKLAPNLAKRGIQRHAAASTPTSRYVYFNMEDPVVGGYTPDKVALRRAISLAYDVDARDPHRAPRPGDPGAVADRCRTPPATTRRSRARSSDYDPARAKALLDLYGYVDRDGDGWREQPDGKPLVLECATQPDQICRASSTSCGRRTWTRSASASTSSIGAVARAPEGRARRQAADVVARLLGRSARRPGLAGALLRPAGRRPEPGALQAAGVRRDLRAHAGAARRPRARRRCSPRPSSSPSPTAVQASACTASSPTWRTRGWSATGARCSGRTGGTYVDIDPAQQPAP